MTQPSTLVPVNTGIPVTTLDVDVAIVGGGMSGLCAGDCGGAARFTDDLGAQQAGLGR